MTAIVKPGRNDTRRGWFDGVFARREALGGRFLQLNLAPGSEGRERFGISVSKRVCATAVSRNYCKRTLRAWYRQHCGDLRNHDLVIRVRRSYGRREFVQVSEELAKLMQRLR